MKLIDIKDTLPVGFIPIQETVDTRKLRLFLQSHALVPAQLAGHVLGRGMLWACPLCVAQEHFRVALPVFSRLINTA